MSEFEEMGLVHEVALSLQIIGMSHLRLLKIDEALSSFELVLCLSKHPLINCEIMMWIGAGYLDRE